jgi:cytochrome c oxidase cbb3-type subunit IV
MFKFIRQYAEKIDQVYIFPIIGLFIFMIFFIVMVIYVKKMRKEHVDELSSLPLDLDNPEQTMNI